MTIDLDQLETLARAATPGPWIDIEEDDENFGWGIHYTTTQNRLDNSKAGIAKIETDFNTPVEKEQKANAAYIAAANPAVVLELVAELRKARAERYWLAEMVIAVHETGYCPPHGECPVVNANPDLGDCVKCWLNAAREAVEKEGKEWTTLR